ncbi:MAG: 4-alpha-glucanotransferase [Bacteroidales bacterium]|nr:4-alpha-glucanotransferase [Bacteroidales bacterium]
MIITFNLHCYTYWGQNLFLHINGETVAMHYVADSQWQCSYNLTAKTEMVYNYFVQNPEQSHIVESPKTRILPATTTDLQVFDTFRYQSMAHIFRTTPFVDALCTHAAAKLPKLTMQKSLLIIDVPAVESNQGVGLLGASQALGQWQAERLIPLRAGHGTSWFVAIDNRAMYDSTEYKFVVYDLATGAIVRWEEGANRRFMPPAGSTSVVIADDFRQQFTWRGAGVAIPIFSLRSDDDWGVGEFYDLKRLIDWAHDTGQKMVQILPINDTTNSKTNADSYPYSAISVYALHPMYLNLNAVGTIADKKLLKEFEQKRKALNNKSFVDYANVNALKWQYIQLLFAQTSKQTFSTTAYKQFFAENKHWLTPYAVFCVLRDQHGTCDFSRWGEFAAYDEKRINAFAKQHAEEVGLHYFVQYHLSRQLTEMRNYAHRHGVALKGDLPIGISSNSVDAWMYPHLYHLDKQAGAPPDDFSITGQNWGFPTYNWNEMGKDGFQWWKSRFQNMAKYFDAYRIDHILGFFRIWEIPRTAIWGLLGYFNPAMPMCKGEINNFGLHFDDERMLEPYITEQTLSEMFGHEAQHIADKFLTRKPNGNYKFKPEFDTQQKVNNHFWQHGLAEKEHDTLNKLLELHTEVLFVEDVYRHGNYHPRITVYKSRSFAALSEHERNIMSRLYEEFYYHRHTEFWRIQALRKLPALLDTTNMLVCGEDLGMVPACVPQVMQQLLILSLEIQRMPKDFNVEFVLPERTPYLSVCSTGTHDTSPLRCWWTENKNASQRYYNNVLHNDGTAPDECTPELAQQIVAQQLSANGMLVVLPLQDYLAIDGTLRLPNAAAERINDPSNPHHFWCYRMHITTEQLANAQQFNKTLKQLIAENGR